MILSATTERTGALAAQLKKLRVGIPSLVAYKLKLK
jgi:hypothetical protein